MRLKKMALNAALLAPLALFPPGAAAADKHDHAHRQHAAHAHGIAALNLVLEGDEVHIELESPAANIVGFEHAPSSEAEHAALDKAMATLNNGDHLFLFNKQAGCRMQKAMIVSALLEEERHEYDEEHVDHHGHADKDDHGHGHEEHGHEQQEGGQTHSDIQAVYHFECAKPGRLKQLSVELFEAFPATEELKLQYIIESSQGAQELTARDHVVRF